MPPSRPSASRRIASSCCLAAISCCSWDALLGVMTRLALLGETSLAGVLLLVWPSAVTAGSSRSCGNCQVKTSSRNQHLRSEGLLHTVLVFEFCAREYCECAWLRFRDHGFSLQLVHPTSLFLVPETVGAAVTPWTVSSLALIGNAAWKHEHDTRLVIPLAFISKPV